MSFHGHLIRRRAFTLIELLAVVVIIAILAAMTAGLGSLVYRKIQVKRAIRDLQNIQLAIEAFYKEYGHYPNCNGFGVCPNDWDPTRHDQSDGRAQDGSEIFVPMDEREGPDVLGLEAFIFSNTGQKRMVGGDAANIWGGDGLYPPAAEKWDHYLREIPIGDYSWGDQFINNYQDVGRVQLQFWGFIIVDPWMEQTGRNQGAPGMNPRYIYRVSGDLQDYELGCMGPDGVEGQNNNAASRDDFWLKKFNATHSYENNE